MIHHHPDINLLTEYAAGALDWGLSLGIASHLHYCDSCRDQVRRLNILGGDLLEGVQPQAVDSEAFEHLLARIQTSGANESKIEVTPPKPAVKASENKSDGSREQILKGLPPVVEKMLPKNSAVKWRYISPALRMARLSSGQSKYEVAFHRIGAGGKVAEHDHRGTEVTIVLKGCFSDDRGVYTPGDFLIMEPGHVHRPTAAQNQDCLCFSICEAPVKLTGMFGKLINPFLSVRPT